MTPPAYTTLAAIFKTMDTIAMLVIAVRAFQGAHSSTKAKTPHLLNEKTWWWVMALVLIIPTALVIYGVWVR